MKKLLLGTGLLMMFSCQFHTQSCEKKVTISVEEAVSTLSSDQFEGRLPGTTGFEKAISYVEAELSRMNIEPLFRDTYRDSVEVRGKGSCNLAGVIRAKEDCNEYVLIGAHIDHVGKVRSASDSVYNGANDDASGVAAVLKIASELKHRTYSKNVILAFFTGEESGMIGSKHLAKKLNQENISLSWVLNIEMIGVPMSVDTMTVYITGHRMSDFAQQSNSILQFEFIKYASIEENYGLFRGSDNYPFYREFMIPSHTLSTFDFRNYGHYHELTDEFSQLDIPHMEYVCYQTARMVKGLLENDTVIELK